MKKESISLFIRRLRVVLLPIAAGVELLAMILCLLLSVVHRKASIRIAKFVGDFFPDPEWYWSED